MSYRDIPRNRRGGGREQETRRLGMEITFRKSDGKIDADLFDKTAQRAAKVVAEGSHEHNKGTQLRRFYEEFVMWDEKAYQHPDKFDEFLPFVRMLKAKAAYAEGRKLVDHAFVELIEQLIDSLKQVEDMRVAKLFFEAFMGFYKLERGDR